MESILVAREEFVKFFKRFEIFIMPLLKFLLGFYVFSAITSVGYAHVMVDSFGGRTSSSFVLLFALLFTLMPMNMSWIIIILTTTMQFSANIQVAAAVLIFSMLIFLFYARMATRESVLIIITLIAFQFNIPYLVPLLVGLYFPVTAVIPVTVGVFINAQLDGLFRLMSPGIQTAASADRDFTELLTELPGAFSEVYTAILSSFASTDSWSFTAIVFAMVIVLVHFVSRSALDYSREIAIGLGSIVMIFGFIVSVLFSSGNVNIVSAFLGTIICALLAFVIKFFDAVLDYQRTESVRFEDDNNFYHVKVVPKVSMTKPQRSVKRIRPQNPDNYPEDDQ